MSGREATISERTTIHLGSAILAMIFIGGLIIWASRVETAASATAKNTEALAVSVDSYKKDVTALQSDVKVIKCHLRIPDPACPAR